MHHEQTCKEDGMVLDLVEKWDAGNCDAGCCPSYFSLYQCPSCKKVYSL